jgi:hypothetical protein
MTKQISTSAQLSYNDENLSKSTMNTLNEIVGFHYYTTRTVFEYQGSEVVFVNEGMLGFVSIYIDGERVLRKWKIISSFATDTSVVHGGIEFRFISGITNWCTHEQRITMIVDGSKAQTKIDPVLSGLSGFQMAHALIAPFLLGMSIGVLATRVIS